MYGMNACAGARILCDSRNGNNTVVVNFEQLAANIRDPAADVILLDTTFWGGIRACVKAAGICETFQLGVAVHSSGRTRHSKLARCLHLGVTSPTFLLPPTRISPFGG